MKKATFVKKLDGFRGDARFYKMDPPHQGHKYVIVSAVRLGIEPLQVAVDNLVDGYAASCETYIFPATPVGQIADWGELGGSIKDVMDHTAALQAAGYKVQ